MKGAVMPKKRATMTVKNVQATKDTIALIQA